MDILKKYSQEFIDAIHFFSEKGWTPATSSNFSYRLNEKHFAISRSGVDKSKFNFDDILMIDEEGAVLPPFTGKSSAETLVHLSIYKAFPEMNAVYHTHSPYTTVLSRTVKPYESLFFHDYEVAKGLLGNTTHEVSVELPVLPNAQNMKEFSLEVDKLLAEKKGIHGFIMQGHGLYTWGETLFDTKRHIETFEFLLECDYLERRMK